MNSILNSLPSLVVVMLTLGANATSYYVSPTGNDANAGTSSSAAFLTPEYALSKAGDGDSVYFAAHTYVLTNTPLIQKSRVKLFGMGPTRDDVVFDAGGKFRCLDVTSGSGSVYVGIVLSGITFKHGFALGSENDTQYNAWYDCGGGVRLSKGHGSTTSADNAVITNCAFIGCTNLYAFGGALKIQCGTIVSNCVFKDNFAGYGWKGMAAATDAGGGAIYFQPGSADTYIYDCVFDHNVGSNGIAAIGSGIYNGSAGNYGAYLKGCSFTDNVSMWSGKTNKQTAGTVGSHCYSFEQCGFTNNAAINLTGGNYLGGGVQGVANLGSNAQLADPIVYRTCSFYGNSASGYGGCLFSTKDKALLVTNCTFASNQSGLGGSAVYWGVQNGGENGVVVVDSKFLTNQTTVCSVVSDNDVNYSGVIWTSGSYNTIRDCTFTANQTYGSGGCLTLVSAVKTSLVERCTFRGNVIREQTGGSERAGGAIWMNGLGVALRNCLFVGNTNFAGAGSAVYLYGPYGEVSNCTFADGASHESGTSKKGSAIATNAHSYEIRNCLLTGNANRADGGVTTPLGASSYAKYCYEDTEGEPYKSSENHCGVTFSLQNPAVGDYTPLNRRSGRNAGLVADWMANATDITGTRKRVLGASVDVGCFECNAYGMLIFIH